MEIYWTLGFAAGLAVGVGIALLIYRNKCEHDWKFVKELAYYYTGDSLPYKTDDLYQCSNCNEYKKVRKT